MKVISAEGAEKLQQQLTAAVSGFSGSWSVCLRVPESGLQVCLNDHRRWSASLIKLYVMAAVFSALQAGTLEDTAAVRTDLEQMITVSSNDAWIRLAQLLGGGSYRTGMERVNRWCEENGFHCSGRRCDWDEFNTTSAEDTGRFLERVLTGTMVSAEASRQMCTLLKHQTRVHKIPAGLPAGVETANKTGELSAINHDAAIVYAPFGTYVLVVLTEGGSHREIAALSRKVYDALEALLRPED